jgi:23S rRNA pseudouridine2605 synthase
VWGGEAAGEAVSRGKRAAARRHGGGAAGLQAEAAGRQTAGQAGAAAAGEAVRTWAAVAQQAEEVVPRGGVLFVPGGLPVGAGAGAAGDARALGAAGGRAQRPRGGGGGGNPMRRERGGHAGRGAAAQVVVAGRWERGGHFCQHGPAGLRAQVGGPQTGRRGLGRTTTVGRVYWIQLVLCKRSEVREEERVSSLSAVTHPMRHEPSTAHMCRKIIS